MNIRKSTALWIFAIGLLLPTFSWSAETNDPDVAKKLDGFDAYMSKVLKDWNTAGIGVGVVVNDKLVFAKGYGYRDYEKKLPFTPATVCPIASNTKLFTAAAAGMLVQDGKLTWDKPIRDSVPTIRFYNDQLNNTVTLRDMLSHRTGVTRHDTIWYKSDFTRKELFDKLKYLEPEQPMRETFLYNNLMFAAAGYMIELQSGKRWEDFVREKILSPLDMKGTSYSISDMTAPARFWRPLHGEARFVRTVQDPLLRGHRRGGAVRSNRVQYRRPFALADRSDERREIQGTPGAAGRGAESHAGASYRAAQHSD